MKKLLKQIISLKNINKKTVTKKIFLIKRDKNIEIYYAPFDYINSKAKIMIVGITPGLQQMIQSFEAINNGKSLKEVKDLSSFKGSMRTTLIKYLDALKINKKLRIKSCESLFNINSKYLHSTSLIKYPVFDKGKNYSGSSLLKKKILLSFLETHFVKELKKLDKTIIIPLGNSVSSTIDYLNDKFNLKLKCFLKGFPHPSGLNVRKDFQFKENKIRMMKLIRKSWVWSICNQMLLFFFIIITIIMIIGEIFPKQMTDFIARYFADDALLIGFFLWIWKLLFIGLLIYYFFF